MQTRIATPDDAADIARIYNQSITDRVGTFETRPRSVEDVRPWFDNIHPSVVVEDKGEVIAFASTSTYRPRECYAGIAEIHAWAMDPGDMWRIRLEGVINPSPESIGCVRSSWSARWWRRA